MTFLTKLYRYFRYYRHDVYVSSQWLQDFDRGYKNNLIVNEGK